MKIEIWSDVVCPFCYIGKRHLEQALGNFGQSREIEVVWHSYQLDPDAQSGTGETVYEYLARQKGLSLEESHRMHRRVSAMAEAAGLHYDFDRAIAANSFDAHRLIQLARRQGLDGLAEEKLFSAYFIEGRDISDHEVLTQIGLQIGLEEAMVREMLQTRDCASEVTADIREAAEIGVRGVPFFVFDRKYAVSGAQPPETLLQVLEKSFEEWQGNTSKPPARAEGDPV